MAWDDDADALRREDPRAPAELAPAQRARRDAALARLRQWGDPVLRTAAAPVTQFDDRLREQVAAMGALMDDAIGAGLAAPQVGALQRLFVFRLEDDEAPRAMVNPEITWSSEERISGVEGCLSIPFVVVEVERAAAITMVGRDEHGAEQTIEAEGHDAVVLQHEFDHLDGVLMLDRAAPEQRREAIRTLRELSR
jgi:peptide deformylase